MDIKKSLSHPVSFSICFFISLLARIAMQRIFLEILHGIYFIAKKFSAPMNPIRETAWTLPEIAFTMKFVEEETKKNNRHVVVAGFAKMFGFTVGWYGGAGLFTPLKLNNTMPKSSKPAVLLVPLKEVHRPYMQSFLKQPGVKLLQKVRDYYFYVLYVDP